jgi:hypothetical protein
MRTIFLILSLLLFQNAHSQIQIESDTVYLHNYKSQKSILRSAYKSRVKEKERILPGHFHAIWRGDTTLILDLWDSTRIFSVTWVEDFYLRSAVILILEAEESSGVRVIFQQIEKVRDSGGILQIYFLNPKKEEYFLIKVTYPEKERDYSPYIWLKPTHKDHEKATNSPSSRSTTDRSSSR